MSSMESYFEKETMYTEEQYYMAMAGFVKALREQFGDGVLAKATKHFGNIALQQWQTIAKENGSNSIEDFINIFWKNNRYVEYEMEKTPEGIHIRCRRCKFCEMAKKNDVAEECYFLSCATYPYITEGFNPNIGLRKTKTLMQGNVCCNHFYYMKNK